MVPLPFHRAPDVAFAKADRAAAVEPDRVLSALEWMTVAIARGDRLSSLTEPGPIAVALGVLFGKRRSTQLADPKLEALRRIAVLSWHRGFAVSGLAVKAFTDAGYTIEQYETLVASICARKEASARSRLL